MSLKSTHFESFSQGPVLYIYSKFDWDTHDTDQDPQH